jgi:hypothetical protein
MAVLLGIGWAGLWWLLGRQVRQQRELERQLEELEK